MMRITRMPMMAPVTIFCWYILRWSIRCRCPLSTHLRIIFFKVPEARSMELSACSK